MRHSEILRAATIAGMAAGRAPDDVRALIDAEPGALDVLYGYARERKFPAPETLARRHLSLGGLQFPRDSLDECPENMRAFYITFRAVAEALEPLHEPDPEISDDDDATQAPAPGEISDAVPASDASGAADPVVGEQAQGEDPALADPVSTAGTAPGDQPAPADQERPADPAPDQVEEKRAKLQEQTDKVIAESGGTFSEPKKKHK